MCHDCHHFRGFETLSESLRYTFGSQVDRGEDGSWGLSVLDVVNPASCGMNRICHGLFGTKSAVASVFQLAKDMAGEVVFDLVVTGDGLADSGSGILIPIVLATVAE